MGDGIICVCCTLLSSHSLTPRAPDHPRRRPPPSPRRPPRPPFPVRPSPSAWPPSVRAVPRAVRPRARGPPARPPTLSSTTFSLQSKPKVPNANARSSSSSFLAIGMADKEATGRDGGTEGLWSYSWRHEETGSSSYSISSSSRSGTIVSTAYTSGSSRHSGLSSGISMEEAALMELELEHKFKEKWIKRIEGLVQEFFHGPSENHSILGGGGGGMSVMERWFIKLGISWLPQLLDAKYLPGDVTWSWIKALEKIMETIRLAESFFADHGHGVVGMPGISEEEEVKSGKQAATSLDPVQFALFFQEAMAKMLVFVDVMFTKFIAIDEPEDTFLFPLKSCLQVNRALSDVLSGFRLQFHSLHRAEVENIEKEMVSLLSAKQGKAFDAIWGALEERETSILKLMEDLLGAETPQGSSDIHKATRSLMYRINLFLYEFREVDPLFVSQVVSLGKYVPQTGFEEAQPFVVSMIAEMISCLEEKLITKSQSFLGKGLGLLFLLNNSNFIREQLQDWASFIKVDVAAIISSITGKVEHYTESYIQVSWEPMLACLFNPTPLSLLRKNSPLSKFESEFQKIYNTQEFCKVPDPGLRKSLRKAIIEKVIPAYTKHIEDSKVRNPKFAPQELEGILQELFEG